ncbi:DUF6527 family protein [Rhodocytophaga rosea]|uniref:DUF6527 family protein n=1 Tax=Rhodocytophaga rosea TaxID=2704465 RepID=UPI003743BF5B
MDWLFQRPVHYRAVVIDEEPEKVKASFIYLIGNHNNFWLASLQCPCGCQETIHLNLLPGDSSQWKLKRHFNGDVTLFPSIWKSKGCKSHFFIRKCKIVWVKP